MSCETLAKAPSSVSSEIRMIRYGTLVDEAATVSAPERWNGRPKSLVVDLASNLMLGVPLVSKSQDEAASSSAVQVMPGKFPSATILDSKIGRAACRERVCQNV